MRNRIYLAVGVTGSPGIEGFLSRIGYELSRTFGLERRRDIQYFMNSAILVGFRRDRSKFRLSETRYLQEAARLGAMILDNYILLLQELEKRRNERQLFLAGRIQKKLTDTIDEGIHGLQVSLLVHPVASVTGDYVDVIELEGGRSGVFLGDVSGHGLGTGYLVSAIRSIIRSHLETGHSLLNTVATVHSFLAERYNGREFLTLFAAIIDPEKGIMEYINAGHPGPILQAPRSGEIRRIPSHVSVLGVIDMELETKQISLRPEQRLFLYSDGVTESFNEKDEPFGMEALEEFIGVSGQIPLETLPILVAERLRSHRGKAPISDDISFIAIQFTPDRVGSVSSYFGLPEESPVDGSDTER